MPPVAATTVAAAVSLPAAAVALACVGAPDRVSEVVGIVSVLP